MKNYVQDGETITFIAPSDLVGGAGLAFGVLLGVVIADVKSGERGALRLEGVVELPKLLTANITAGASLIWDVSASQFIIASPAADDLLDAAVAIEAAGTTATTVKARLSPGSATIST